MKTQYNIIRFGIILTTGFILFIFTNVFADDNKPDFSYVTYACKYDDGDYAVKISIDPLTPNHPANVTCIYPDGYEGPSFYIPGGYTFLYIDKDGVGEPKTYEVIQKSDRAGSGEQPGGVICADTATLWLVGDEMYVCYKDVY